MGFAFHKNEDHLNQIFFFINLKKLYYKKKFKRVNKRYKKKEFNQSVKMHLMRIKTLKKNK